MSPTRFGDAPTTASTSLRPTSPGNAPQRSREADEARGEARLLSFNPSLQQWDSNAPATHSRFTEAGRSLLLYRTWLPTHIAARIRPLRGATRSSSPSCPPPRPRLRPRRHRVLDPRIAHCRREEDDSPPVRPVETRTFPRSTTAGSRVDRTLAALRLVRARSDPREPRCACRATPERTDRQSLCRHHEPIKGAAVSTHSLRNNPTTVVTLHPFRETKHHGPLCVVRDLRRVGVGRPGSFG